MVESIEEFQDELKALREEIREMGPKADTKLVASWLDRLVIALEKLTPTIDLMSEGLDQMAEGAQCECECCMPMEEEKPMKKKAVKKGKKKK